MKRLITSVLAAMTCSLIAPVVHAQSSSIPSNKGDAELTKEIRADESLKHVHQMALDTHKGASDKA